jgi:glycosyltransferase involved in cell wall biosynthesis
VSDRVLFVVPNVPWPLASGGHRRDWAILNLLAQRGLAPPMLYFGAGESALLAPDTPVARLASSVAFGGARVEHPDTGVLGTAVRKLSYLAGTATTHPFAFQYDAIDAVDAIVREAARVGAGIVVVRGFWCHGFARLRAAGLRVIANCPDSNTRLARELVRSVEGAARLGPLCNLAHVRRLERRHLRDADEIWVPTTSERDEIAAIAGGVRCLVLPNVVDVAAAPDLSATPGDDDTLLLVANFAYAPNANAARRLLDRVWPVVRQARPAARLCLVGGGMAPALRARARADAGVEMPGFVDDLAPWYRRASVVLLPVREGAGMLFKTIEALALGKATVGFPEAYRGIDADPGSAFLTVASEAAMAESALGLLADGAARRMLGAGARALAERRLSFEHGGRSLDASLLADVRR